ncbi:MAG: hypothetical protein CMJ50_06875 [Planctomycetaceae bacterium]|jgi:hypothetical protein|nr:hypothetical protein [Planctomycetaceae bacterium]
MTVDVFRFQFTSDVPLLGFIDQQFPLHASDDVQKAIWNLARAMFTGYADRYATEDFEIVEVELPFTGEIRNPDTNRPSQTFVMAGKVDGIVNRSNTNDT